MLLADRLLWASPLQYLARLPHATASELLNATQHAGIYAVMPAVSGKRSHLQAQLDKAYEAPRVLP